MNEDEALCLTLLTQIYVGVLVHRSQGASSPHIPPSLLKRDLSVGCLICFVLDDSTHELRVNICSRW